MYILFNIVQSLVLYLYFPSSSPQQLQSVWSRMPRGGLAALWDKRVITSSYRFPNDQASTAKTLSACELIGNRKI